MRTITFLFVLLSAFYFSKAQPRIHSFSPLTAEVGSIITIQGTGFSSIPSNNIVYFGPVKASVNNATDTTLSVIAPAGAVYAPISVTVDSLTALSSLSFSFIFPEAMQVMSGSFEEKIDVTMRPYPALTFAKDFDADGKTDLVVTSNETISLYRNKSTLHNALLDTGIHFATTAANPNVVCGDIDGDGKIDILVSGTNINNFQVYRNTSTPGNISFQKITKLVDVQIYRLHLADVNGDGKTDVIATTGGASGSITVYKNLSSPGNILFATKKVIPTVSGLYLNKILVQDLDNDGKADLGLIASNALLIFKNSSTLDSMSFFQATSLSISGQISILSADFNRDGKMDIAISTYSSVNIFRSTTNGSNISFANGVTVPVPNLSGDIVSGLQVADFDGDEWPDIAFMPKYQSQYGLYVISNQSNGSNISFRSPVSFYTGLDNNSREDLTVLDIDNDSKPDLITTNTLIGSLSLFLNKGNQPMITHHTPSTGSEGTLVTMKGFNFNNSSIVNFGNSTNASFTVVSDTLLTATVPAGAATGLISVTNPFGPGKKKAFTLNVPTINSITPFIAKVGDTLSITGTNFIANLTDNIVKMGATSARVIDASNNEIKIVVPHGSTRQPLTVTNNTLTGYFDKTILLPFEETGPLTSNSFVTALLADTDWYSDKVFMADLNEDGKPDLLTSNFSSLSYSILRNTSNSSNGISFAPKVDYRINTNSIYAIADDLNGDGKPELVLADNIRIRVLKNNSIIGGALDFNGESAIIGFNPSPYLPTDVATGDFDRDGRPDILLSAGNSKLVSVFKNKSLNGHLEFNEKQDFAFNLNTFGVVPADINNDGITDIVANVTGNNVHRMYFLKNTTVAGADKFSFDTTSILLDSYANSVSMADIDGDGYNDLCVTSFVLNKFSVYRNLSNGNSIAFGPRIDFSADTGTRDLYADDLNGDGKIDIVTANRTGNTISIFKGLSVPGTISFAPRVSYPNINPHRIFVGDLDADGRPDIVTANNSTALTIIKNKVGIADDLTLCPGGSVGIMSNLTGTNYKWHQRIGTEFVPIDDNINYAGTNSNTLQLNNLPSSFTGNAYSCLVDGNFSNIIQLSFRNTWTGTINSNWEEAGNWSCGSVPDSNTDVVISAGNLLVNSNVTIRSLVLNAPATVTVTTGNTMTILR